MTYDGEDTYKTLFGGLLSMVFTCLLIFYFLVKGQEMYLSQNWNLTQQVVVESAAKLTTAIKMSELKNVTVGIQLTPKKEKQLSEFTKLFRA